jgi:hemolysin activation/secretion protein
MMTGRLCPSPFLAAALSALAAMPVLAQQIPPGAQPGVIQERRIEEERRLRQQEDLRRERIEKPVDADALRVPARPAAGDELRFMVREIEFSPSAILTADELETLAAPYRNRMVSLAELHSLVAQINELYRKKGVVTAQALLPPQDLSDGKVRIRLVEGRIGKLSVQGNPTTDDDYVTNRIRQQPGDLVDLPSLEKDLKRFNRYNDAQLRAELKPGEQVGQTDIGLLVAEPPRHDLRLFADNLGSPQTGQSRLGVVYRNRSLLGRRDEAMLSTVRAEGQESYSVSYGLPVGTLGTRLQLAHYDDKTRVIDGPFAKLKLSGESVATVLSLRHPLLLGDAYQLDAVLGAKKRASRNWLDRILLQDVETRDTSLGLEGQLADSSGYWLASATYLGVRSRQAANPSRTFHVWRGVLRRHQELAKGFVAVGGITWQHTRDDFLPASEQFLLGGEGSVRGYAPGILSGDRGAILNLELHHPLPLFTGIGGEPQASGFFFIDSGYTRPYRPPGDPRDGKDSLTGVGWGMNVPVGKGGLLRATYGLPRINRPEETRNYRITIQFAWNFAF